MVTTSLTYRRYGEKEEEKTKQEFIKKAIENGVQNDSTDVWVEVNEGGNKK